MAFTQLNSPIPVYVLGKGKAMAFAVIDYGPEHDLVWVSAVDDTGEVWCVPNPKIRMQANWTLERATSLAELEERGGSDTQSVAELGPQSKGPVPSTKAPRPNGTDLDQTANIRPGVRQPPD